MEELLIRLIEEHAFSAIVAVIFWMKISGLVKSMQVHNEKIEKLQEQFTEIVKEQAEAKGRIHECRDQHGKKQNRE